MAGFALELFINHLQCVADKLVAAALPKDLAKGLCKLLIELCLFLVLAKSVLTICHGLIGQKLSSEQPVKVFYSYLVGVDLA